MTTGLALRYTEEEYLAYEAGASEKHEYWGGYIVALAGAELNHNRIKDDILRHLYDALAAKGCEVITSDQRVKVDRTYVYPDVVVFCGEPQLVGPRPTSLVNPSMLVEVLSPSTTEHDLIYKVELYRRLPSLQEFWMVSSSRHLVVQHIRTGDGWQTTLYDAPDAEVTSEGLGLRIGLSAIYRRVTFEAETD